MTTNTNPNQWFRDWVASCHLSLQQATDVINSLLVIRGLKPVSLASVWKWHCGSQAVKREVLELFGRD